MTDADKAAASLWHIGFGLTQVFPVDEDIPVEMAFLMEAVGGIFEGAEMNIKKPAVRRPTDRH
jgi:hypothetical protein